MESVGDFFRQVRETKGLTLDDVASKTRIHPDFLKALEEGNFSKLPDQVFAKGFVRSYARSLGLDEEDAMRRFDLSAGNFYDKQSETERLRLKQVEDDKRKKANRKVVVAAAAVALLGLVLLLTREQSVAPSRHLTEPDPVRPVPSVNLPQGNPPRETSPVPEAVTKPAETELPPPAAQPEITTPPPEREAIVRPAEREATLRPAERPTPARPSERSEPVPSSSSVESSSVSSAPEVPGDLSSEPVPATGLLNSGGVPLVLELEATDLSWVVVQVDGASPHEALLRPGERIRWKAHDRFVVTLGNAGGVRVELNGKPQGPFGPAGKVARDIVLKR